MRSKSDRDLSITVASFFMKCTGFWLADNPTEQRRRNFALYYTVAALLMAVYVECYELYQSMDDFSELVYVACGSFSLFMALFKILILYVHRTDYLNLILYTQKNFWYTNYDAYEGEILTECKKKCTFFVFSFTVFAQGTICCYIVHPIVVLYSRGNVTLIMLRRKVSSEDTVIQNHRHFTLNSFYSKLSIIVRRRDFMYIIVRGSRDTLFLSITDSRSLTIAVMIERLILLDHNIGRNETDRRLPFPIYLNLPLSITPYFEIMFCLQILSLYHVGICYLCFDNLLCIMNVHTAGQFRMLQYRLSKLCHASPECVDNDEYSKMSPDRRAYECYRSFKTYVQEHQGLIDYCKKLENIFTFIVLGQVSLFSVLMCLVGYEILLADISITRRLIFIFHITGSMCQLMMFTYSCDGLIEQSGNVATAAYSCPWTSLPATQAGDEIRKDLIMVILRARRPCCLTACGFFPVSLQTYTTVLSTAMSYFTLMRQQASDS